MIGIRRVCSVLFVIVFGLGGCATSGGAGQGASAEREVWEASREPLPESVRDFIFHDRAPVVVRAETDGWEPVEGFLSELVKVRSAGGPEDGGGEGADGQFEGAWKRLIFERFEEAPETFEHVDRERAAYITVRIEASPSLYRAYRYGLGMLPRAEMPRAMALRVAVPSERPEALADQFRAAVEGSAPGHVVVEADRRWVRLARVWTAVRDEQADDALVQRAAMGMEQQGKAEQGRAERGGDPRRTPARVCFERAGGLLGAYVDIERLRDFLAARAGFQTRRALQPTRRLVRGPEGTEVQERPIPSENRQKILAGTTAHLLNLVRVMPASQRAVEDACVTLEAGEGPTKKKAGESAGTAGLAARLVHTQTALGREIQEAARVDVRLPTFSGRVLPADQQAVGLEWSHDLPAVLEQFPVNLTEAAGGGEEEPRSLFRSWRYAGYAFRSTGDVGLAGSLLANPHLLVRELGTGDFPHSLAESLVAGRIRVTTSGSSGDAKQRVRAAGVLLLDGRVSERLRSALSDSRRVVVGGHPIDVKMKPRDSGRVELRWGLNVSVDQAFDDQRAPVEALDFQLEPKRAVAALRSVAPSWRLKQLNGRALRALGTLNVERRRGEGAEGWVVSWGMEEPPPADPPDVSFEPAPVGPACVDRLTVEVVEAFESLEALEPMRSIEALSAMIEDYDAAADRCIDEMSGLQEELEFAKGRFRWFMMWRIESAVFDWYRRAKKECRGAEAREGERVSYACRQFQELEPKQFNRNVEFADEVYAKACELGDERACEARDELPEKINGEK